MIHRPEVPLDELYREVVLDHHKRPRGRTPLHKVDARAHGFNPVCGDEVMLSVALDGDAITGVQLEGRGCAICTASGSIMAELVPGRTADQANAIGDAFRDMLRGHRVSDEVDLGDLEALQGVRKFAVRVKCAMLPWVTLADAIRAWRAGERVAESTTEQGADAS